MEEFDSFVSRGRVSSLNRGVEGESPRMLLRVLEDQQGFPTDQLAATIGVPAEIDLLDAIKVDE